MTTIQIGSYIFDGTTSIVQNIDGIDCSTPLILNYLSVGRRPGKKVTSAVYDAKKLPIGGVIFGSSFNDATQKMDDLKEACSSANVAVDINDGTQNRRYYCGLNGDIQAQRIGVSGIKFMIPFIAMDPPFAVEATQGGDEIITSALNAVGVNQDVYSVAPTFNGSVAPKAKTSITVTTPGSLASLELVDKVASTTMSIVAPFIANDVITIDSTDKKVLLNNVPQDFTGQFPDYQPGTGAIDFNFYTSTGLVLDQSQILSNGVYPVLNTDHRICQSIKISVTSPVSRVSLVLSKVGTGADVTFTIQTDDSGKPSGTVVANSTFTIPASALTTTPNWFNENLSPSPQLTGSTVYWLVLTPTSNSLLNYVNVSTQYPGAYADGGFYVSNDHTTYTAQTGKDFAFKIYRGIIGENNQSFDETNNLYDENFSTTTKKDAGNTTANWNTAGSYLTMNGTNTNYNDTTTYSSDLLVAGQGDVPFATILYAFNLCTPDADRILTNVVLNIKRLYTADSTRLYVDLVRLNADNTYTKVATSSTVLTYAGITTSYASYTFAFNYQMESGKTYFISPHGAVNYISVCNIYMQGARTTYNATAYTAAVISLDSPYGEYSLNMTRGWTGSPTGAYHTSIATSLAPTEYGQTNELASTSADIISTSQVTTTILLGGSTYQGQVSANNGTSWTNIARDTTPFQTDTIPAVISNQLKFKWGIANSTTINVAPYVTRTKLYYKKGMSIDATTDRACQSLVPTTTASVQRLDLYGLAQGTPGDITIRVETDSSNAPSGTLVHANANLTVANPFLTTFGWATLNFANSFTLTATTKYWIVISAASVTAANRYLLQVNNGLYTPGSGGKSTNSGSSYTLFSSNEDFLFRFYQSSGGNFAANIAIDYVARYL